MSAQGLDHGLRNNVRHVSAAVARHLCGEARLEETGLGSYERIPFSTLELHSSPAPTTS